MIRKKRRLVLISSALAVLSLALGLVLLALRDNIVFFYGPSELAQKAPHEGQRLRIGGLVKQESLVHEGENTVRFAVTDTKQEVEGRALSPRALLAATKSFTPIAFSPNMMNVTCRARSPMP
jgi:cytochrome c-type biogenesis protein CcmE